MWRKNLKTREAAKKFHRVEVDNRVATSFWHDHWFQMGRLIDMLGAGGRIALGIQADMIVVEAIFTHQRRRHRLDILNKVEDELDQLRLGDQIQEDIALWRDKTDKFKILG